MAAGKVVRHRESNVVYAVSEHNFDEQLHEFIRDLKPGETVLGFKPKPVITKNLEEDLEYNNEPEQLPDEDRKD